MDIKSGIFIFHRDFRIEDNTSLRELSSKCDKIYLIFIFDPRQLSGPYFSQPALNFLIECLEELSKECNINVYMNYDIIKKLSPEVKYIAYNTDYTPFSILRDKEIINDALKANPKIEIISKEDYLLLPAGSTRTASGVYTKFTPYYNAFDKSKIPQVNKSGGIKNKAVNLPENFAGLNKFNYTELKKNGLQYTPAMSGGRSRGLAALNNVAKQSKYHDLRDDLTIETTHLSPYIKFGCISIREAYYGIKEILKNAKPAAEVLHKQLIWREFYTNILYYHQELMPLNFNSENAGNLPLKEKYKDFPWLEDRKEYEKRFLAWCNGATGYPIVDAAMHQLNTTGYMHNRGRLITSNFLIKLLRVDWRDGERYFATKLIDYDPAVNNGNWQWSAGCGADSQPYFRVFNPWTQAKDHDSEAKYIKKYIPELSGVSIEHIHEWDAYYKSHPEYIKPIVDYDIARAEYLTKANLIFKL